MDVSALYNVEEWERDNRLMFVDQDVTRVTTLYQSFKR